MQIFVKAIAMAALAGMFAGDAMAQSQGPLTPVPWAARARPKPNPEGQTKQEPADSNNGMQVYAPPKTKPVEGAPDPGKEKTADR